MYHVEWKRTQIIIYLISIWTFSDKVATPTSTTWSVQVLQTRMCPRRHSFHLCAYIFQETQCQFDG